MPVPLLIHIGMHKTGSSYLQRLIFDDVDAGFRSPIPRPLLRRTFLAPDAFAFCPRSARNHLTRFLARDHRGDTVAVLSHEQFSGQPAGGGYGLRRREREVGRGELAERLHTTFPEARILLVIREQRDMLRSIYKWMVCGWQGRLSASPRQFLDQSSLLDDYSPLFHCGYLEYHSLVAHYQQSFGASNVLVLPYEWLKTDPLAFVNHIRSFVDLNPAVRVRESRVNPGQHATLCLLQRPLNRLLASPNRPGRRSEPERYGAALARRISGLLPERLHAATERRLARQIDTWVHDRYTHSNQKTARLTGLDLRALGYTLPDEPVETP
ncbi:sulfotransferase [Thioalkalivibrio sp. ALE9]|uniref:sulfotransferase n=1 Tax=Thioalkalivibrio sp. ALE9 TaxID=1158169 RepID=UPI00038065A7|nr:sulfotransferase [Thioalkalivibrio sp. ALE9]